MDSQQAKRVLALYRSGVTDPDDTQMAEALEQAQRDPELAAWFERQSATNDAIRARLKSIPVPEDLRRRILEGHAGKSRVLAFPKPAIFGLAAAALLALAFFLWQLFMPESTYNFEHFRDRMARYGQRTYTGVQFASTNQAAIRDWFQAQHLQTNFDLPPGIEGLPGEGGAVLTWENQKVCMLCLTNAALARDVWVYIAELKTVPEAPAAGKPPELRQIGNFMTASWSAGDKVYLVTGATTESALRDILH